MNSKNANIPLGFSSNPSSWKKRLPLLALALAGFFIALYLGFYQLHFFNKVWEPFFGNGTKAILESSFSRSLPFPDALAGAFAYLCDIILVSIGDNDRWETKPWVVLLYSGIVGIMAVISIFLVFLQAFILHSCCTLCLASAVISLTMIWPVSREFFATLHFVQNQKHIGKAFLKTIEGK